MDQVEALIKRLYDPVRVKEVEQTQAQLQDIQRSSIGWQLAEVLLNSQDQNVRFFAALTYTVKLNQDGPSLSENDLLAVLDRLLSWIVRFVETNETPLVTRKICSTLVAFFVLPNAPWTRCIRHVICSLLAGRSVPEADTDGYPNTGELVARLNIRQFIMVLTFSNTLATDGARIDHDSPKFHSSHLRIGANVADSTALMQQGFVASSMASSEYREVTLQCFQAWVQYAKLQYSPHSQEWQDLQGILGLVSDCLFSNETFAPAATFFIDTFADFGEFLSKESIALFFTLFNGAWAQRFRAKLQADEIDEDVCLFGQMALSFGQRVSDTVRNATESSEQLMSLLHQITRSQNYENIEQNLSNAVVDFWDVYVLQAATTNEDPETDGSYLTTSPLVITRNHCLSAILELTNAIVLPVQEMNFIKLGSDHPFSEFRFRVSDVMEAAYDYVGGEVIRLLVAKALSASEEVQKTEDSAFIMKTFSVLEATFYGLGSLSHSLSYEVAGIQNDALKTLFDSPICALVLSPGSSAPIRLQKVLIQVIGHYHQFFGHHPEYLFNVLDLLFQCLEKSNLIEESAWVVFRLCNRNRKVLTTKLAQFLDASDKFLRFPSATAGSKEYMAGAVAAIVQSLNSEKDKVSPLSQLLGQIERQYTSSVHFQPEDPEIRRESAEIALSELKRIAEAFREPEDDVIDLDDSKSAMGLGFWTGGEGAQTQMQIVRFLGLLTSPHSADGSILESLCDVLKAGYKETSPGPFVFPPSVTVDLLTSTDLNNPRFDISLQTAAAFISSHSSTKTRDNGAAAKLFSFALEVIRSLQSPEKDPDLAYQCIDLVSRFIPAYLDLMNTTMSLEEAAIIFSFSVRCLETPTPLPKQSASHLWKLIIDNTSPSAPDMSQTLPNLLLEHLGAQLTQALVFGIGGNAARSELDVLIEPLKKLAFKQPQQLVKSWLESALFASQFPSQRIDPTTKRQFSAQVLGLRGARKTNSIVKDFALACRGLSAGYG